MEHAGPLIGMPFSLEGFAFFLEAIFLGIWLYGWERIGPRLHLASGILVAISGTASGVFVVAVNAWMNTPVGFTLVDGKLTDIHPMQVFASPAFPTQAIHMTLAAYTSIAILVAGIHAKSLLRTPDSRFHAVALHIALVLAVIAVPLQIVSGDFAGKQLAKHQPAKLAALEAHFETRADAPLSIGGIPRVASRDRVLALEIPYGLSVLAHGDPHAVVTGLDQFPEDEWPPVVITHIAFQIMVACGVAMLGLVGWVLLTWLRKRSFSRLLLRSCVLAAPLGMIALEAGWVVTEVGRQPWIVRGVLRTAEAVTPMPGLIVPFIAFTLLYLVLGIIVIVLLRAHVFKARELA